MGPPLVMRPRWMQFVGGLNPLTFVAVALRALFDGRIVGSVVVQGFVNALVLAVVGLTLGTRAMRRANG